MYILDVLSNDDFYIIKRSTGEEVAKIKKNANNTVEKILETYGGELVLEEVR